MRLLINGSLVSTSTTISAAVIQAMSYPSLPACLLQQSQHWDVDFIYQLHLTAGTMSMTLPWCRTLVLSWLVMIRSPHFRGYGLLTWIPTQVKFLDSKPEFCILTSYWLTDLLWMNQKCECKIQLPGNLFDFCISNKTPWKIVSQVKSRRQLHMQLHVNTSWYCSHSYHLQHD